MSGHGEDNLYQRDCLQTVVLRVVFHNALPAAARILLRRCGSLLSLWIRRHHCVSPCAWHRRLFEIGYMQPEHPDWEAEIQFEWHFKPPPDVVSVLFAKIAFHVFLAATTSKSRSYLAKKWIWAGRLNICFKSSRFILNFCLLAFVHRTHGIIYLTFSTAALTTPGQFRRISETQYFTILVSEHCSFETLWIFLCIPTSFQMRETLIFEA